MINKLGPRAFHAAVLALLAGLDLGGCASVDNPMHGMNAATDSTDGGGSDSTATGGQTGAAHGDAGGANRSTAGKAGVTTGGAARDAGESPASGSGGDSAQSGIDGGSGGAGGAMSDSGGSDGSGGSGDKGGGGKSSGSGGHNSTGGSGGTGSGGTGGMSMSSDDGGPPASSLGLSCDNSCTGTFCTTTTPLCADSDLAQTCIGTATGLFCSRSCTRDADCDNPNRPMECLTSCSDQNYAADVVGRCWTHADHDFLRDQVCGDATTTSPPNQPALFCPTSEPSFSFLEGFESYAAGPLDGASPRWSRVTTSNFGADITSEWAHGCGQNLTLESSYASNERDFAALDFPSRPSKLNLELWYTVDAFANSSFARFGFGNRPSANSLDELLVIQGQGSNLVFSTPWLSSVVVYDGLATSQFGDPPNPNYVRVEFDFCQGKADFYVGADAKAPLRKSVSFGGVGEFTGFFVDGGPAAPSYFDDIAIWTPSTTIDRDNLCPVRLLNQFSAPGSACTGLAWDGSALWLADNLGKLYQLNPTTGAMLAKVSAPADQPLGGLAWDGVGLWTSGYRHPIEIGLNGHQLDVQTKIGLWSQNDRIAWDGSEFWWFESNSRNVSRYDRTQAIDIAWPNSEFGETIAADSDSVWMLYTSEQQLVRFDQHGQQEETILLKNLGIGSFTTGEIAWDGAAMWLCTGFDVYRIQLKVGTQAPAGSCTPGQIACGNQTCVAVAKFCDGQDDCGNGFDEAHCKCVDYSCNDGTCLPQSSRCDKIQDCSAGEDEMGCP